MARHARDELGLSRILLVPVNSPPHKPTEEDPGADHRLAMVRLLARDEPGLVACDIELRRAGTSYTVDTLRQLHARDPDTELTLIVGADMARTLPAWRDPHEILRLATIAVAEREGSAQQEIMRALAPLNSCRAVNAKWPAEGPSTRPRIVFLDMPEVPVSSTMVRDAAAKGRPLDDLVTAPVADYIGDRGLYRVPSRQEASR